MRIYLLTVAVTACALAAPTTVSAQVAGKDAKHLEQQAKRAEADLVGKLDALQRQLKLEESRMNAQIQQLSKQRDAALKKNDQKALERIEKLEVQAIKQYDSRVQHILAPHTEPPVADPAQRGTKTSASTAQPRVPLLPAPGVEASAEKDKKSSRSKNRRRQRSPRRLRLFPF